MSDIAEYMRAIGKFPLPTREGDIELAKRIEVGDHAAKKTLLEAHLRLVVSIAWSYKDRGVDLINVIQEGNIGLVQAVERFEWRGGATFSRFATPLIRQAIERALGGES